MTKNPKHVGLLAQPPCLDLALFFYFLKGRMTNHLPQFFFKKKNLVIIGCLMNQATTGRQKREASIFLVKKLVSTHFHPKYFKHLDKFIHDLKQPKKQLKNPKLTRTQKSSLGQIYLILAKDEKKHLGETPLNK